ncbi:MAG: transglycosylase SLT domain-containing protein [Actinomycetes bacterium]
MRRTIRFVVAAGAAALCAGTLSAVPVHAAPTTLMPAAWAPRAAAAAGSAPSVVPKTVVAPTPKAVSSAQAAVAAFVASGPSRWRGAPLRHPRGTAFYPTVVRWANLVRVVMSQLEIPQSYLAGVLSQIQQESAGQPKVINLWDSNAKAGTPSMGLLQIIAPTYRAYAKAGYKSLKYQAVPYTNLWAALAYAKSRYGMAKFAAWSTGSNVSY